MTPGAHWASWLAWSALAVAGVALGALYAGLETGIYVLNKIRLDLRAETGSRRAKALRRMLVDPTGVLAVLLVGTNVSGYVATFAVSAMFVLGGAGNLAEWYTLAVVTPLMFVLRESVPKAVFQRLAERLVYSQVWLLTASRVVFAACGLAPLVWGFSRLIMRLTRVRGPRHLALHQYGLDAIMAEGIASGVLTPFQSGMARRVMNIGEVTLGSVMVPMSRMFWAPRDIPAGEFLERIHKTDHSRVPLVGPGGRVEGVVDIFDVLTDASASPPAAKMAPPFLLPATMNVPDALYRVQQARAAMIIVEDADGKHVGLATIKDLVEEIVGELAVW